MPKASHKTSPIETLETVLDWFRYCTTQLELAHQKNQLFFGHGCANATDEAAWLVLSSLHLPLDNLNQFAPARLLLEERELIVNRLNARIKKRIPMAYVLSEAWLAGERFISDARAIVPRSLIAELLDTALEPWLAPFVETGPQSVLDMCCGGGSLTLLAAKQMYPARVVGADISEKALSLARENLALHAKSLPDLAKTLSFINSDLFANIEEKFDLILCNPPYVNSQSMRALPKEYTAEPALALDGGEGGMMLMPQILKGAAKHLNPNGALVLELGNEAAFFEARFPKLAVTWLPTATADQAVFAIDAKTLSTALKKAWI